MSEKYKIWDQSKPYFVTMTVVGWVDVFSKAHFKKLIANSLRYCQEHKGLEIYGYCLMSNHLHMIVRATGTCTLSEILRDFKKFTSKEIVHQMEMQGSTKKEWLLAYFQEHGKDSVNGKGYKIWQNGNHPLEISSNWFFDQKLDYIHNNPVKELIVERPEDYIFSSARNYAGLKSYIEIPIAPIAGKPMAPIANRRHR